MHHLFKTLQNDVKKQRENADLKPLIAFANVNVISKVCVCVIIMLFILSTLFMKTYVN